jgi:hypothetical protein
LELSQGAEIEARIVGDWYAEVLFYGFSPSDFDTYFGVENITDLAGWYKRKFNLSKDRANAAARVTMKKWQREGREPNPEVSLDLMTDPRIGFG